MCLLSTLQGLGSSVPAGWVTILVSMGQTVVICGNAVPKDFPKMWMLFVKIETQAYTAVLKQISALIHRIPCLTSDIIKSLVECIFHGWMDKYEHVAASICNLLALMTLEWPSIGEWVVSHDCRQAYQAINYDAWVTPGAVHAVATRTRWPTARLKQQHRRFGTSKM